MSFAKVPDHQEPPRAAGNRLRPESNRLAVANDQDGSCELYDGTSLRQTATVELNDDADNIRYDNVSRRFWVGYGDGGLAQRKRSAPAALSIMLAG